MPSKMNYNFLRFNFFLFLQFFFVSSFQLNAQFERSLDSLYQLNTSIERTRGFLGSAEELKLPIEDYKRYMDAVQLLADKKKDKLLSEQLVFIKELWKQTSGLNEREHIEVLLKLTERYKENNQWLYAGQCHHFIAKNHFHLREYGQAFENYFEAYEIFEKIGFENVPVASKFLHDFALSRYYFKDYNEVIKLMHISVKHPPYNSNYHIQRYNNLGVSYSNIGQRDSAIFYFEKTNDLGKKYNSKAWEGITLGNIGNIYFREQNYTEALTHFNQQYQALKDSPFDPIRIFSYLNVAKTYLRVDSISKADGFLKLAERDYNNLRLNKSYGDDQQLQTSKRDYYDIKSEYFLKTKRFPEALAYKDSLAFFQKKIDSTYNSAIVKMSSDRLLIKNKELKLSETKRAKANQQLFYIILIAAILIVGGVIYVYMYLSKLKKKRQSERLIAQNRIAILEKQKAEKELQQAKNEIEHFISKISEHNHIVSKLEEDLKKLKNLENEEKQQVNQALHSLKTAKILTDEDWYDFQYNFEASFPEFTGALKSYLPNLTASEIRYLMLIKLGLNNKEMARALGVSDAAIRVTWSRIRKKLDEDSDETPAELIERISQVQEVYS